MIAYEELCEALDRFNRRRHNQAEMDQIEDGQAAPQQAVAATAQDGRAGTFSLKPKEGEPGFADTPPEDTHEIDVDDVELG